MQAMGVGYFENLLRHKHNEAVLCTILYNGYFNSDSEQIRPQKIQKEPMSNIYRKMLTFNMMFSIINMRHFH